MRCARSTSRSATPASVSGPATTSTIFISGTGLKKWKPATRPGSWHAAAIAVTDSDEVLVARMQPGATTASSAWNSARLASRFSTMASTTSVHGANSASSAAALKRPAAASTSAAASLPFAASFSSVAMMASRASCAAPGRLS